jgi:hypothetical protein
MTSFNPTLPQDLKINKIKDAIERALKRQSGLSTEAIEVPALSSLNIRHLLNNLGAISTITCDHGSHVGGSYCSMVYGNENIKTAIAIDSWASDHMGGLRHEAEFRENADKFTPSSTKLLIVKSDSFEVNLDYFPKQIDLYYFDGSHDYDSQRKALTYYLPAMADEFIFCVDDYMLDEVKKGTQDGINDSKCEVLFEQEFITDHEYDNESFWRGWYLCFLKKIK